MISILSIRYCFVSLLIVFWVGGADAFAEDKKMDHSAHTMSNQTAASAEQTGEKWIKEKTGDYIPLQLDFVAADGGEITLEAIIDRPTIILPIYFYCPAICSENLANLAVALSNLSYQPGSDYRVIALSFNDVEDFEVASRAKVNYIKIAGKDFPPSEWFFLTGKNENIKALTDSMGFRFRKMDDTTFIHPSALIIVGADGKIIRYVYGSFLPGDIDMALLDAEKGTPSLSVKRLLAFCFSYDPDTNKSLFQIIKVSVLALFGLVIGFVLFYFRRKNATKGRYGSKNGVAPE